MDYMGYDMMRDKSEINVLITSVSRKVWLVKAFKRVLTGNEFKGKVITIDADPLSAGLYVSDKYYIVPDMNKKEKFLSAILDICKKENIRLLIPTRDGELLFFAKNKKIFEDIGTTVMVSDPKVIEVCNDKYKFYKFLTKANIPTPKTYLPEEIDYEKIDFPLFIKPRYGSGGSNSFKVRNEEELRFLLTYIPNPIIQEFVEGTEYTIDLFSDFEKRVITVVPRERIKVFCGESYKGKTVKDYQLIEYAKKLAESLNSIGHITIQCIKRGENAKFIEVNPRFGGGAILGIEAGANTPLILLKLIKGEKVSPSIGDFKENLIMLRYTEDIFIHEDHTGKGKDI